MIYNVIKKKEKKDEELHNNEKQERTEARPPRPYHDPLLRARGGPALEGDPSPVALLRLGLEHGGGGHCPGGSDTRGASLFLSPRFLSGGFSLPEPWGRERGVAESRHGVGREHPVCLFSFFLVCF